MRIYIYSITLRFMSADVKRREKLDREEGSNPIGTVNYTGG